jgi:hypothetical protein
MVKALALNAISGTIVWICVVIGIITGVDGVTLHTIPMLQLAFFGSFTLSILSTFTAGVLAVKRAMRWLRRRA